MEQEKTFGQIKTQINPMRLLQKNLATFDHVEKFTVHLNNYFSTELVLASMTKNGTTKEVKQNLGSLNHNRAISKTDPDKVHYVIILPDTISEINSCTTNSQQKTSLCNITANLNSLKSW